MGCVASLLGNNEAKEANEAEEALRSAARGGNEAEVREGIAKGVNVPAGSATSVLITQMFMDTRPSSAQEA